MSLHNLLSLFLPMLGLNGVERPHKVKTCEKWWHNETFLKRPLSHWKFIFHAPGASWFPRIMFVPWDQAIPDHWPLFRLRTRSLKQHTVNQIGDLSLSLCSWANKSLMFHSFIKYLMGVSLMPGTAQATWNTKMKRTLSPSSLTKYRTRGVGRCHNNAGVTKVWSQDAWWWWWGCLWDPLRGSVLSS